MPSGKPPCGRECKSCKLSLPEYANIRGQRFTDAETSRWGWAARKRYKELLGKPPEWKLGTRRLNGRNRINVYPCGVLVECGLPCVCRLMTTREFMRRKGETYSKQRNTLVGKLAGALMVEKSLEPRKHKARKSPPKGFVRIFPIGVLEQAYARLLSDRTGRLRMQAPK